MKMKVPTPKALHPKAQGRATAKPPIAPWVTVPTTRTYPEGPEGVSQNDGNDVPAPT